jgi:hypothetical protein
MTNACLTFDAVRKCPINARECLKAFLTQHCNFRVCRIFNGHSNQDKQITLALFIHTYAKLTSANKHSRPVKTEGFIVSQFNDDLLIHSLAPISFAKLEPISEKFQGKSTRFLAD